MKGGNVERFYYDDKNQRTKSHYLPGRNYLHRKGREGHPPWLLWKKGVTLTWERGGRGEPGEKKFPAPKVRRERELTSLCKGGEKTLSWKGNKEAILKKNERRVVPMLPRGGKKP